MTEQYRAPDALDQAVALLAETLDESASDPLETLRRIIQIKGMAFAERLLARTLEIEEGSGLLTQDGTRRRTRGGIFFFLARRRVTPDEHRAIWPYHNAPHQLGRRGGVHTGALTTPASAWAERGNIYATLALSGEVHRVNINLVGRPGRIAHQGDYILTTMHGPKAPALPRGLPRPPEPPARYAVCIARRQWEKVAQLLENPEDALIVDGYAAFDNQLPGIIIYAKSVTTKLQQMARRQQNAQPNAHDS